MAKVDNNIFVRGLTGAVGDQFVIRKGRGGKTIIANKPSFAADRVFNAQQLAHQDAFRMAIAYAKDAKTDELYITKAQGTTMTAFNAAVADWFNKPVVLTVDASAWTGDMGQVIRIQAQDDTKVTEVKVVIRDDSQNVVEEGLAVQGAGLWWEYTTTADVPNWAVSKIVATAKDLPGNSAELEWQN